MKERNIPINTKQEVLREAGFRCAVPTCRNLLAMDLHHIVPVSEGGLDDPDNLIALCPTCHALHHRGVIPQEAIRYWKGMLMTLNRAFDHETVDSLLFLHKMDTPYRAGRYLLQLSGDGVLKFSRLIAAGLATFDVSQYLEDGGAVHYHLDTPELGAPFAPPGQCAYGVRLTEKGRMLVDAWIQGDRAVLEQALVVDSS